MKTYTVELNENDILLIEESLRAWETAPQTSGMLGDMFSVLLAPKSDRGDLTRDIKDRTKESELEVIQRQRRATLLKAKLYEITERPAEFAPEKQ